MSPTVPPISTMATSQSCGDLAHGVLDLVGDVGDDLDGLAEVVAAAFLGDDLLVDAAGGEVVVARELGVGEALVVAEVEVGLGAVVGDEDLAVLEGRHGAGVDVEVGVKLHEVDLEPACFEEAADGGCGEALAEGRHDSACYKDVLCRHVRDLFIYVFNLCVVCTIKYRRVGRRRQVGVVGWGVTGRDELLFTICLQILYVFLMAAHTGIFTGVSVVLGGSQITEINGIQRVREDL